MPLSPESQRCGTGPSGVSPLPSLSTGSTWVSRSLYLFICLFLFNFSVEFSRSHFQGFDGSRQSSFAQKCHTPLGFFLLVFFFMLFSLCFSLCILSLPSGAGTVPGRIL